MTIWGYIMKLRDRILKALNRNDGKLTQSQLTRSVVRVSESSKQDELKLMQSEGLIKVSIPINLSSCGVRPTVYELI